MGYRLSAQGRRLKLRAVLPNLAKQFAAQAFFARLAAGHDAPGRGQNVDAEPPEDARDLGAAHIDAATGARYPLDVVDGALIVDSILQVDAEDFVALFLRRLDVG